MSSRTRSPNHPVFGTGARVTRLSDHPSRYAPIAPPAAPPRTSRLTRRGRLVRALLLAVTAVLVLEIVAMLGRALGIS